MKCLFVLRALLSACVIAVWGCSASSSGVEFVTGTQPNQQSHCASWMSYFQCDRYNLALEYLSEICPEAVWWVTGSSYNTYYDPYDTENYGYSYPDDAYSMWLTGAAFTYGELANTIAHEYGHNVGMNEPTANAYGNSCGYGSQY